MLMKSRAAVVQAGSQDPDVILSTVLLPCFLMLTY